MRKVAIGLDIGGTDIKAGIVDVSGKIIASHSGPTQNNTDRKTVLANVTNILDTLLKQAKMKSSDIQGIGVGTPGLVDSKGLVLTGVWNIKGWNGTPIGDFLRKKYKTVVIVENDVTALALGESCFGNGKGYDNIIVLAFGTGLGGGIIINKDVYRGHSGYAGEFGHTIVNGEKDAPFCTCGARGCIETYASTVGIKRMLKEAKGVKTVLNQDSMPRDVYEAAQNGDKLALKIVDEVGYRLGISMASFVNLFDPAAVILGGGIANAGPIFYKSFQKSYFERVLAHYKKNKVKFLPTKLGREGGIVGTASLILHKKGLI